MFTVGDEYLCLFVKLLLYNTYFHLLAAGKIMQVSFSDLHSAVVYPWSYRWYCTKLQTIKWAVSHGSTILSADFLGRLSHTYKNWLIIDRLSSALGWLLADVKVTHKCTMGDFTF